MEPLSKSAATDGCCDNGDDKLDSIDGAGCTSRSNVDFLSSEVRASLAEYQLDSLNI